MREKEYAARRKKIAKKLKKNSVMLLCAAEEKIRSNDTHYPYRQSSNFHYLTGLDEPQSALVILKGKTSFKTILFVQKKEKLKELWEGKVIGVKKAKKRFFVDEVHAIDSLQALLKEYLKDRSEIYYEFGENSKHVTLLQDLSHKAYAHHNIAKMIEAMRLVKSKSEIELIKKGMRITKKAHHQAMRLHKAGMREYELQAEFEYIFKKHGAYSDAYTTIVAGGENANTLHYIKNDKPLKAGDLVLIDAGCEYQYYATDITRTIPVSGRFSKAQKELYSLVLEVEKKIIEMIRPGVLRSTLHKEAERLLTEGMVRLGILKGSVKKLLKKGAHKSYFPHGIGHFMGLDVHDQNPYKTKKGKEIPLQAGMVLTIEPGLYFPKNDKSIPKKYRGIGIRIEDDILVTKNGYENLSRGIAKEIEAIERLYS